MNPRSAAPFFSLAALVHLAACASRFPELSATLEEPVHAWIAFVTGALLLVAGYFEGQLNYGVEHVSLPRWMTITSRPVKWSFSFAFIYLSLVAVEVWDLGRRGLNPFGPESWDVQQRAIFFVGLTVGMSFIYYLHASKLLIPLMRVLSWPARRLPRAVGLPVALIGGSALGLLLVHGLTRMALDQTSAMDLLLAAPIMVVLGGLAGVAGLALIGAACLRS